MKYYSFEYTGFNYFDGKKRITTSDFATGLEYIKIASLKYLQEEKIDFKK